MSLFALTNIVVVRGHDGKSRSSGAFLSITITFLLSAGIWLVSVLGWPEFNSTAIAWFAVSGFLTIFIGRVFVYASMQHLGAIRASAIKRLNPFFAVLLGVLLLGESISGPMMVGMALIVTSGRRYFLRRRTVRRSRNRARSTGLLISVTCTGRFPHLRMHPATLRASRA
jgi:drug/metabolite transporter (DMT)-like permease